MFKINGEQIESSHLKKDICDKLVENIPICTVFSYLKIKSVTL